MAFAIKSKLDSKGMGSVQYMEGKAGNTYGQLNVAERKERKIEKTKKGTINSYRLVMLSVNIKTLSGLSIVIFGMDLFRQSLKCICGYCCQSFYFFCLKLIDSKH